MANSFPVLLARRGKGEPPLAQREFPGLALATCDPARQIGPDVSIGTKLGGDKGTRLPPGAFAVTPLETPPLCLSVVQHGHPPFRHTSTCHVADCVQADWRQPDRNIW
uniref:AGR369Wp n=1 Tax=uncultured bacterium BAC AB649/1850 TaxID=1037453 RepID=F6K105_9BACT|nr:AGR369Wp [uncultured bacterium BAC AB649/1850]